MRYPTGGVQIYPLGRGRRAPRRLRPPRSRVSKAADPDRVFAAPVDPESLAQLVPQLMSIRQGDGDRLEVEAR
jgi:hypothetical protein